MENKNTIGTQFRTLHIIHAALCLGLLALLAGFRYLVKLREPASADNNLIMEVAGVAIAFINVLAARFLFFVRTQPAQSQPSLGEKIAIFRVAFLVQMVLLESAGIANLIFYFITGNELHFFIALGVLLLMLFRRPTRVMAAMVLFNAGDDVQQIYNDELPL
jgi:hypothetical protein